MAVSRKFDKTALVMGILSTLEEKHDELLDELTSEFGPVLKVSDPVPFSYTDYYNAEMGGQPVRYLILFQNTVDPSCLADIKKATNAIEMKFADSSNKNKQGRRVNIDPGILSLSSFILATCKDRSHRIPLKDGIYAETTLIYQDKDFQRLPWTYADYSDDRVKAILRDFRSIYKNIK